MTDLVEQYKEVWGDDPSSLLKRRTNYIGLTRQLDELKAEELDRKSLYEIILWKLGRFPEIDDSLIADLRGAAKVRPKEHIEATDLIRRLLKSPGIALPMASTILRFLNPTTFQIIDDRAYRVLLPREPKYPSKPKKLTETYVTTSIEIYFKYLDELHKISSRKLPFHLADRILYQLDIELGNAIGTTNSKSHSTRTRQKR